MPKVSINILTKNRSALLRKALESVARQSFKEYEVIVVDDGSADETVKVLQDYKITKLKDLQIINHQQSFGITKSRQEALEASIGEYVAILDDDDEWMDIDKISKQVKFLNGHPNYVLVGGGIVIEGLKDLKIERFRSETDRSIRNWMLIKNSFFTSTVMFRREAAIKAGGFVKDEIDLGEDYDLWLRMGKLGKMYNFKEAFTLYAKPSYNKEKFKAFLQKQLYLIYRHKDDYPWHFLASLILKIRLWF